MINHAVDVHITIIIAKMITLITQDSFLVFNSKFQHRRTAHGAGGGGAP